MQRNHCIYGFPVRVLLVDWMDLEYKESYHVKTPEQWLISTHNGIMDIPPVDINKYPAIKIHLDQFNEALSKRLDKGITPYNLRSCNYLSEFSKEKLFWQTLSEKGHFAYSKESDVTLCLASAFLLTGDQVKFLCGLLNSHLITWYMRNTAVKWGDVKLKWLKTCVQTIPLPEPRGNSQYYSITELVDKIVSAKTHDSDAYTLDWENEVNNNVYSLYGLTDSEINITELNPIFS